MKNINYEINFRKITKVEITTQKCLDIKIKICCEKILQNENIHLKPP